MWKRYLPLILAIAVGIVLWQMRANVLVILVGAMVPLASYFTYVSFRPLGTETPRWMVIYTGTCVGAMALTVLGLLTLLKIEVPAGYYLVRVERSEVLEAGQSFWYWQNNTLKWIPKSPVRQQGEVATSTIRGSFMLEVVASREHLLELVGKGGEDYLRHTSLLCAQECLEGELGDNSLDTALLRRAEIEEGVRRQLAARLAPEIKLQVFGVAYLTPW